MTEMTREQIDNWRKMLMTRYGVIAFLVPDEEIIALRDRLQADIDEHAYCKCDPKYHGYTKHQDGSVTCNHCQKPREASHD